MDLTKENLESTLIDIKAAIRNTPGRPATFATDATDSSASEKVLQILTWHEAILVSSVRKDLPQEDKRNIINSAYMYAVQPPIVKDPLKSKRKEFLRLQPWIDWLLEENPTLDSFQICFRTWSGIFAQEFKKMQNRQNTDTVIMAFTPQEKTRTLKKQENLVRFEMEPSPEPDEESMVPRYSTEQFSHTAKQLLDDLNNEKKSKVAALMFLLHYLQWKEIPSFPNLCEQVLEKCVIWSGRSFEDLGNDLKEQAQELDVKKEVLAARRINKDYPLLSYAKLLPLLDIKDTDCNRYYVAISRYRRSLSKLAGTPEFINIKDLQE
ncbi:MAG: hypothetical protein GX130_08640 [Candidatus Hydrogenedens sp.]|jgi:hypothetical protein|nr:hypothetical protein [Candidatus Hydrogenedens sp.]